MTPRDTPSGTQRNGALDDAAQRGASLARRTFVFFGAMFVAGCASSRSAQVASGRLPGIDWCAIPDPEPDMPPGAVCTPPAPAPGAGAKASAPAVAAKPEVCIPGPVPFARPRTEWTRAKADYSGMDRMLPPKWITVHHDGMTPYWGKTSSEAKARLEWIRTGHRGRGFGDIGYHYIIDREGVVWQGRDVTRWQGAHVSKCNEHNVGVMCMGNFVLQSPSDAQVAALNRTVAQLRARYGIPAANVRTHREWPGARTACPGDSLQARVRQLRKDGFKA